MSARALLDALAAAGVAVWSEAGAIRFRAPQGALTPELRRAIADRRAELLALLAAPEGRDDGPERCERAARAEAPQQQPPPLAAAALDERAQARDVAIIGMACRFPGAADLEAYWDLLRDGVDAIGDAPPERRAVAHGIVRCLPGDARSSATIAGAIDVLELPGGWLRGIEDFDPLWFGISPREARSLSPELRLVLETTWLALEHAGYAGDALAGSRTGVFFGDSGSDYSVVAVAHGLDVSGMVATGNAISMTANRLSYVLDLRGPSMAIDTACSSSLVALHVARQSLLAGECEQAIVGGVNLILNPLTSLAFSRAGMLAPDGRCRTFDERASGYVRGEGVGVIVLKPLARARGDRDRIWAVVRGSAVNHDGHSKIGLSAPSPRAQRDLLLAAFADARIDPSTLSYVEAHGTGTRLGDPVEIEGLTQAFRRSGGGRGTCGIGSVKSNIGHLEAAAGIAGLIKVILALDRKELPPSLHFERPNPAIPFAETPFRVVARREAWDAASPRRAGVSSFGFGGANAHVILEEPGESAPTASAGSTRPAYLLPLSARTARALDGLLARLRAWLPGSGVALRDACFTASVGRAHLEHRIALVAGSGDELIARIDAALAGTGHDTPLAPRGETVRSRRAAARPLAIAPWQPDLAPAAWRARLDEVAQAFVAGTAIDWSALFAGEEPCRVALPTSLFDRRRCWFDTGAVDASAEAARPGERHDAAPEALRSDDRLAGEPREREPDHAPPPAAATITLAPLAAEAMDGADDVLATARAIVDALAALRARDPQVLGMADVRLPQPGAGRGGDPSAPATRPDATTGTPLNGRAVPA